MAFNLYNYVFQGLDGRALRLDRYRNQPVLMTNFDPDSEYLPQLWKLQRIYNDLRHTGLLIVAMPCLDDQQLEALGEGLNEALTELTQKQYGVRFPITENIKVRGLGAHPMFLELRESYGPEVLPRRSLHKYLFSRQGQLVNNWPGHIPPDHPKFQHVLQSKLQAWVV